MTIIAVPELAKPEIRNHHKLRHLKKMAIGPFAQTCAEIRFVTDIEKFDEIEAALVQAQQQQTWELFIAYFNQQYHVAITFLTEQTPLEEVLTTATEVITELAGPVELDILAGDANYGDWDSCYAN
ncbi:hypothetical protein [Agarivorans sp. QJM3NY_25]|uniref:hypothetical protein n=1 Tax=Agarivorans sp. QJM3NY_25 TaxID=3421430 RepID=UPI003D7EB8E0